MVGYSLGLPAPRTAASVAKHLRTIDPIALRRDLILMASAHCRPGTGNDESIDRAAAGDPAAIDQVLEIADCKMAEGIRRLLLMAPAETAELFAATIEGFERDVFHGGDEIAEILERDASHKRQMARAMDPTQLVEVATNGVTFTPLPDVDGVVLIPSIVIRPWVMITQDGRRRVFCYPVAEEHLIADPDAPPSYLVAVYRALGDERRLRLLRILSEGPAGLAEITARMDQAKSTVHHHLSILRQAGLVRITVGEDKEYSLRRDVVPEVGRMLAGFLNQK
jgi:DNA-binding transcriptional ArsR family regulator